jgi:hypothetical protein
MHWQAMRSHWNTFEEKINKGAGDAIAARGAQSVSPQSCQTDKGCMREWMLDAALLCES